MKALTGSLRFGLSVAVLGLLAEPSMAQRLQGEALIAALREGGNVLVMRQAPASLEAARSSRGGGGGFGGGGGRRGGGGGAAAPEPTEEALETTSRQLLTGMRHAVWTFDIPVAAIYAGPALATRQHAEEIPFVGVTVVDELGGGPGWLEGKLAEPAMAHSNTIVVTSEANIRSALGLEVGAGETLVVRPGAEPEVVGRLTLRDWSVLAVELGDEITPIYE